jgi:hypothetical protein
MAGSAPRADAWIAVEHPAGWADAELAGSEHGARVVLVRDRRDARPPYRVWVAHPGREASLRVGTVADPAEVTGWDLAGVAAGSHRGWGRPDPQPLLLVCANGRRDRCCGHAGGRLADRLRAGPWAARVLTSTHLGGHRFAPTALLLPSGVLHGRLDLDSATEVLAAAGRDRTPTATLRGSSTLAEPAQVAEARARRVSGYDGLAPLAVEVTPTGDPDRALAQVGLPTGETLAVPLLRTRRDTIASCDRAAAPMARWTAAPAAAG